MSSSSKNIFGFHAVGVRIKTAPQSVFEVFYDVQRRDARMRQFTDRARESGVKLVESDGLRLLLSLQAGSQPLIKAMGTAQSMTFLSGPEGGLSAVEEAAALAKGFAPVTLGPRVLRSETAPLACLSLMMLTEK